MAEEISRIGEAPSAKSFKPQEDLVFGLLDVVAELAGILVAKGIFTATELQLVMENREKIARAQVGDIQALPAKTMAEIAALWAKPRALAFPADATVIPLFVKNEPPLDAGDDEPPPSGAA
jgi:hypothetical protein